MRWGQYFRKLTERNLDRKINKKKTREGQEGEGKGGWY